LVAHESPINPASPPRSHTTRHKSRHIARLSNVPLLGRSALFSRIQQAASQAPPGGSFPNLTAFLQLGKWLLPYLRDFFHKDHPYQTYPAGKTGLFDISTAHGNGPLRIAVTADWATGTLEAETVAANMQACSPHYTLHLGDVYYMGEAREIGENCLGTPANNYAGVRWPKGLLGSFALMGNHEMYSGGKGYFTTFLNELGILSSGKVTDPQSASYFCLENAHWLLLGLDTGYHSGGLPVLGSIPLLNQIPSLNVDARFDPIMLAWLNQLTETLQAAGSGQKPVVVLTHHQPVSSFDQAYQKPAQQLAEWGFLNGREFVWLFGHEHRLAIYKEQTIANTLRAYPRCIGHGGMPVDLTRLKQPDPNVLYYDPRQHPIDKDDLKTQVGYNGHVVLIFNRTKLTIEYRDIVNNGLLLTETFTPEGSGALHHSSSKPPNSPLLSGDQTS